MNGLMTVEEVARAFGVTPKTVLRWEKRGLLRSLRTLGPVRYRFRREDVLSLLEAHTTRADVGVPR